MVRLSVPDLLKHSSFDWQAQKVTWPVYMVLHHRVSMIEFDICFQLVLTVNSLVSGFCDQP